jgi:NADH dehydrogenase
MTTSLFITGASGFIGRELLSRLAPSPYDHIYCLSRHPGGHAQDTQSGGKVTWIAGSLEDVAAYAHYLARCETVVHLAGLTGKAARADYFKTNTEGTAALVEACKQAGVRNFLFISTIAVKYPEKAYYYYAQSKELAEKAVRESGLCYAIVRPTIVLGGGSANWKNLSKLANAPVVPLFGGGQTRIQPIAVEDLADCLVDLLDHDMFMNETYDLGGPETLTFEAFFTEIRHAHARNGARAVRIPIRQLSKLLARVENGGRGFLPITAGQLSAFQNDGTVAPNRLHAGHAANMKSVSEAVRQLVSAESDGAQARSLDRECIVFMRYFIGQAPTSYVLEKYHEAHVASSIFDDISTNPFDTFLLNLATKHTFFTRLVDAYTAIFAKRFVARKKLVLLLAILETCAPSYLRFEAPDAASGVGVVLKLAGRGVAFALTFLLAILLFAPAQLLVSFGHRSRSEHKVGESAKG